jgi:5-methylcytosine-specific restriction enzyme subunit McrC
MIDVDALEDVFGERALASGATPRTPLLASEHDTVEIPVELIRPDGSLDVYPDVLRLFTPTYSKNRPSIQCRGLVGHIPLNDAYALEVATRVPVGNLERLISMAKGYSPDILRRFSRLFAHADDQLESLFDALTDQLLAALDRIWDAGLLKIYREETRRSSSPKGRLFPLETALLTARAGRPTALSSSFERTPDFGTNRVLRLAVERLLGRYVGLTADKGQRERTLGLQRALYKLSDVGQPMPHEITRDAISRYVLSLPPHHDHYDEALMVAHLVLTDLGVAIRGSGTMAVLPPILIDMAKVFESALRRILADGLADDPRIAVKDGNMSTEFGGAKVGLYDSVRPGIKMPDATPDIVIEVDGKTVLVIDAKYKPAPRMPDRNDVGQVVVYGARYGAKKVMLLHAERPANRPYLERAGAIGEYEIISGMVNLNAIPIEAEEAGFVEAIRALL